MNLNNRFFATADLIRLTKQYGTLLLMLPALWSLILAGRGKPPLWLFPVFVAGAFIMRSAGCVINDIADRNFDSYVERTKNRPLAAGRLKLGEAAIIFTFLILLAFGLVLLLNRLALFLSVIALFLAIIYPFAKRFINLPQLILGTAFGWGAIIAWAAVRGRVELPAILIFLSTIFWATGYDTIYALMDREDDLKIGVKSTAILFGQYTWQAVALFFLLTTLALGVMGWLTGLGLSYYLSLILISFLFGYQVYQIKDSPDREIAFRMFVSNVTVGMIVLVGITASYLIG